MNCQQAQRELNDLLDARARKLPEPLAAHVHDCGECREAWECCGSLKFDDDETHECPQRFWKTQEAAVLRRVRTEGALRRSPSRASQLSMVTAVACILVALSPQGLSPIERGDFSAAQQRERQPLRTSASPQGLSWSQPSFRRSPAGTTTGERDDTVSLAAIESPRSIAGKPFEVRGPRAHIERATREPHREPSIDIRVTQFASARLATRAETSSLPPREYEIVYVQLPDGSERVEARPLPVVIINPFVDDVTDSSCDSKGDGS